MGWDEMGWDEMGWDEMGWDEMGWDEMGWDEMEWQVSTTIILDIKDGLHIQQSLPKLICHI